LKFVCNKNNLLLGVTIVQKAVSAKNTMPILGCIYLEAADDHTLVLRTTDLEFGIEHVISVETIEPGKAVLPAKYFIDIVRHLPDTEIMFELAGESMLVTYAKSRMIINTYPADEFPNLPVINNIASFTLNSATFKKAVKQAAVALAIDNNRPMFTGILLEYKGENSLTIVATDTHRLAYNTEIVKDIEQSSELNGNLLQIIVPGKVLIEVCRILDTDSMINLIIGKNNQVAFKFSSTLIYSRLILGQYPNYRQVMPNAFKAEAIINTKDLLNSLERAALLIREDESKKRPNNVKLNFQEESLTLDSYAQEVGNIHEEINIQLSGEEINISFNARYLLDAVKVIDDEKIRFKFTGPLSPATIEPAAGDGFIYLILPVRNN
jgi:DNA polymerase-3 subunit beta